MSNNVSLKPSAFRVKDDFDREWVVNASRALGKGRTLIRLVLNGGDIPTRQELEAGVTPIFLVAQRGDLRDQEELQDTLTDFIVGCIRAGVVDGSLVRGRSREEMSRSLVTAIRGHFADMAIFLELDPEVGRHESFSAFMALSEDVA